jgi:hypothetical protein
MPTTQAHHLNGHETIPAPDARSFDGADRYLRADSPAPDADADDLWRRTGAIGNQLHALADRAVGVRDQHARQIDALKAELAAVNYGRSLALAALGLILGHAARTTGVCPLCGCALTENTAHGEGCAVGAVISELGR